MHGHAAHDPYADADRFVPYLWTVFLFVLGCNLFGMIPWLGAPTAAFGTTLTLGALTMVVGVMFGMEYLGPIGFFTNMVPQMKADNPAMFVMLFVIKIAVFFIEVLGLVIKHAVLGVRLLANMVAGHLVILGIMGLIAESASAPTGKWSIAAVICILGSTAFNLLELFVAFLQAYVFTFLSALFISAAIHRH